MPEHGGLYEAVLGPRFFTLAPAVRAMHGGSFRARGRLDVRHGTGRLARLLARVSGAPPEREGCPVVLDVAPCAGGQTWTRSYDGYHVVTRQLVVAGRVAEVLSGLALHFDFDVTGEGALVYRHVRTTLDLGPLRFPFPRALGPRAEGSVSPSDAPNAARVSVSVSVPFVGLLVSYEGDVRVLPHEANERRGEDLEG